MTSYRTPIDEMRFVLQEVIGIEDVLQLERFGGIGPDLVDAVLHEAANFVEQKLAPLNRSGDQQGARCIDNTVQMPDGFADAYRDFVANGWNAIAFDPEYGGQGLPHLVSAAVSEMISGANMAFGLCPLLTQGAVELLGHYGTAAQKKAYLSHLIAGTWTGTMCLTEPQAGSDLGAIATHATPQGDHYHIKGQKIFITYGEHDMAENIIHMVLARMDGAPEGSRGISLFIVPKYLADGKRNDVKALSIEHKLGIHASPTCVMAFGEQDACVGYLVGEAHAGLKYMFTMMNHARLAVGIEGIGVAAYALQLAEDYAQERKQMGVTIASHPDVKRMLLSIRSQVEANRALAYLTAKAMDMAKYHPEAAIRRHYAALVSFLIPVVKAHATQTGFDGCSEAIQIFGGIGYTEEMGVAQCLRDIRITMIYEGTNGIQAQDLVMRKLLADNGAAVVAVIQEMEQMLARITHPWPMLDTAWKGFKHATQQMQQLSVANPAHAKYLAHDYLKLCGIILGGIVLSLEESAIKNSDILSRESKVLKQETILYYMHYLLPQTQYLCDFFK